MSSVHTDQMQRINIIAKKALAPEWLSNVEGAISDLESFFTEIKLNAVDFGFASAESHAIDEALTESIGTEDLARYIDNLRSTLAEVEWEKYRAIADARAAQRELAELKEGPKYGFPPKGAQAEADAARRELEEVKANLKLTSAELLKANHARNKAEAEADAVRRELTELRVTLEQTRANLDAANQAKDEADAVDQERGELRVALEKTTSELRGVHHVADALRNSMVCNSPTETADAVAANIPTGSAGAEGHRPEAVKSSADTHPSDETAAERQQGWKPNFDAKAVGVYWRTVTGINADLEAGRITTRQASGRKAAALRSYNAGAKLGSRARTPRWAA